MWNHKKLLQIALAEEKAFLDGRMDRLYYAICRFRGLLLERPADPVQALQDRNAALDALSIADIRRHMMAPEPPDSIYEEMLALKQLRIVELAQVPQNAVAQKSAQPEGPTDDSEPEQNQ